MSRKPLGEKPRLRINIMMRRDLLNAVTRRAQELGVSRSQYLADCALEHIERLKKIEKKS